METINLGFLVKIKPSELPKEFDKFNVIYKITNAINGDSYIGQAKSFKKRFLEFGIRGYKTSILNYLKSSEGVKRHSYLFNAFGKYGIENFEISIIQYDINSIDLSNLEIYWISHYDTFQGKGYNMTKGGDSPSVNWSLSARKANLRYYPDTNGASPEFIKAGIRSLKSLYPSTNGANPNWLSAGARNRENLKIKYPETNGAPPQWISAGKDTLKLLYPDTNGAHPNWISAGNKAVRFAGSVRAYDALVNMCNKAKLDGMKSFNKMGDYMKYKVDYAPQYCKNAVKRSFNNFREFGFDITLISEFIRIDWQ